MTFNRHDSEETLNFLKKKATTLRLLMLRMARGKGEGYIGQGLGIADVMAALYFYEMKYDPKEPNWADRDRFILSSGHYAIALWAALAEAQVIPKEELDFYGTDGSLLQLSTLDNVPGVEVIGGSLAQGLGQGVGMALGLRLQGRPSRLFVELSDGELQEGATWEAAMAGSHFKLHNLVAMIDCNGIQADGKAVLDMEPVAKKWSSFGWETVEIDGNNITQLLSALKGTRNQNDRPKAIVLRTIPGKGIATLERREKSHFIRVDESEWERLQRELEESDG